MLEEALHPPQSSLLANAGQLGTVRLGKYAAPLQQADHNMKDYLRSPTARGIGAPIANLNEQLFDARSKAKQLTALIAMHLSRDWRDGFFKQVDNLLDADEWDDRDIPVAEASFRTFLRLIIFLKAERRPGISATANGELMATWRNKEDRLTIYCRPSDNIRWVVRKALLGDASAFETAAGNTVVTRLPDFLAPFGVISDWGFKK